MASFNNDLFRQLLTTIEQNIKFLEDGISKSQCFDLKCNISIDEILNSYNKAGQKCDLDELKYCLSLLREFGYIDISNGAIGKVTREGVRFILFILHNINCNYQ